MMSTVGMKCTTHHEVITQVPEKLDPLSNADIKIKRWPDIPTWRHTAGCPWGFHF